MVILYPLPLKPVGLSPWNPLTSSIAALTVNNESQLCAWGASQVCTQREYKSFTELTASEGPPSAGPTEASKHTQCMCIYSVRVPASYALTKVRVQLSRISTLHPTSEATVETHYKCPMGTKLAHHCHKATISRSEEVSELLNIQV